MKKLVLVLVLVSLFSCKKDATDSVDPTPTTSNVKVQITYNVDGEAVLFDTVRYTTPSGLPFSVVTVNYFLSNIYLIKSDSSNVKLADYFYGDGRDITSSLDVSSIAVGNYIGIKFNIGVDSAHNVVDGLPATVDYNNMIWPEALGGGYHFLKFEGYFTDAGSNYGYAMHLGKNPNLVPVVLYHSISVSGTTSVINLKMNLNEWLKNPSIYDFNTDGNYSMMNDAAMQKLSENGTDVFSF